MDNCKRTVLIAMAVSLPIFTLGCYFASLQSSDTTFLLWLFISTVIAIIPILISDLYQGRPNKRTSY